MKQLSLIGVIFISFVLLLPLILAVPEITINSPRNISYDSTKVIVDVSSNENVDFFFKDRRGRKNILAKNTNKLESFIYLKEGIYKFEIWANNSNGLVNESIVFSTDAHNPINVTDCGYFYSSDTKYVLNNDIKTNQNQATCIYASVRNATFDLNGNVISAGTSANINHAMDLYGSDIELFNGTINGSASDPPLTFLLTAELAKSKIYDLNLEGFLGIWSFNFQDVILENVTFNNSIGFWNLGSEDTHFINSNFVWNGEEGRGTTQCFSSAFCDWSGNSEVFLQDTTISNFPNQDLYLRGAFSDFYLRNSDIDMSKINYPEWAADVRIYDQHLILINVTDQLNESGSGVVEIVDGGILERKEGLDALLEPLSNPTADLLVATEEDGTADVWVTEKLVYARSSSPAVITEYDFSVYNLTAKSWESQATASLNLTGVNSIIPFSIKMVVPRELPPCTLFEMLDLNNDESIDVLDALVILKHITGKDVEIEDTKTCAAIGLR